MLLTALIVYHIVFCLSSVFLKFFQLSFYLTASNFFQFLVFNSFDILSCTRLFVKYFFLLCWTSSDIFFSKSLSFDIFNDFCILSRYLLFVKKFFELFKLFVQFELSKQFIHLLRFKQLRQYSTVISFCQLLFSTFSKISNSSLLFTRMISLSQSFSRDIYC